MFGASIAIITISVNEVSARISFRVSAKLVLTQPKKPLLFKRL